MLITFLIFQKINYEWLLQKLPQHTPKSSTCTIDNKRVVIHNIFIDVSGSLGAYISNTSPTKLHSFSEILESIRHISWSFLEKYCDITNSIKNMIFNERQYITTKARINEFGKAIAKLESSDDSPDPNQKLRKQVHLDALNSQLEELQEEIAEYQALKTGEIKGVTINSFEEWPEVLIKARIARGWSQEQFANILEVHPQQIQRDESTRYAGASLKKIIAIQKALGITVKEEVSFN